MTQLPQRHSPTQSESGQAAVMMAFLLFLAFLAFAALAIDGAMTYLVRRDLQNLADSATLAACRAIADNDKSGGNTVSTNAMIAAKNAIGDWATQAGTNPPSTNAGSGVDLVKGIEIGPVEVRVALQRLVPTVLTQFVGRGSSYAIGRARCNSRAAGGLLPIAVRRYDGLSSPTTDFIAKQGSPPYSTDSITVSESPARYPNSNYALNSYQLPVPCGNPGAPGCAGGANYVASDSAVAGVPDANTGPEVPILGNGAGPSTGAPSYTNFVMLDIRDVASGTPEYYNGATGNPNTDKNISQQWIFQGYPLNPLYPGYPEYFLPGEEMAVLDGASASFEAQSVSAKYKVGDPVAVIVYDGNVWDTPGFKVNLTPVSGNGINASVRPTNTTSAISYTVTIVKDGNANWATPLNFSLNFKLSEASPISGGSCGDNIQMAMQQGSWNSGNPINPPITPSSFSYPYAANNVMQATGWTGTLYVWTADPTTTVPNCISGLNLIAVDSQGLDHGTSSNFGFAGGAPLTQPYYTLRSGSSPSAGPGIITIQEGQQYKPTLNLNTQGFGSANNVCRGARVTANVWTFNGTAPLNPWTKYFSAGDQTTTVDIDIKNGTVKNPPVNYALNAQVDSSIVGTYLLRFTVDPSTGSNCTGLTARSFDVPLDIEAPPGGTSTPTKFVVFQGYAVFRISYMDANTIKGYAIGPLYQHLSDITFGMTPRLVPWN